MTSVEKGIATMDAGLDVEVPLLVHGQTWEEMAVGNAFRTSRRTITESDLVSFIAITGFNEPLFYDADHAREGSYTGRLVPGMLVASFAEGLVLQTGALHGTGLAFMHTELDIKRPVYVGDTIEVVVRVTASRASSGGRGVVTTENTVLNQKGEPVVVYQPVRLIRGRDYVSQS